LVIILLLSISAGAGDKPNSPAWPEVAAGDLAMKTYGKFPDAQAVILYRRVERNDVEGWERHYVRIKILTEEGKKYGDVATDSYPQFLKVSEIEARTIRPDGTIVPFSGTVFEKLVVRYKDFSVYSKALTMPDVQVGSIIEYRYKLEWSPSLIWDSEWAVQGYLPMREADFSLVPQLLYKLHWTTYYLSALEQPLKSPSLVTLKVADVAPLEKEPSSPPEEELRSRVEFTYFQGPTQVDEYWNYLADLWSRSSEEYMSKSDEAQRIWNKITVPSESAEVRLRKIYDFVQNFRNLSYERQKSEKEQKGENRKPNKNSDDVLKHRYGYHNELVRGFITLARSAGFNATMIRVADRDQHFFHKESRNFSRLRTELAVVKLDGKDIYLDPGIQLCPFGLLSWEETAVPGILLNKEKALWSSTPKPTADQAIQKRTADLMLDSDGNLSGSVTLSLSGQEALYRRLVESDTDDTQRRKDLAEIFKSWLPFAATVSLEKMDDFSVASDSFTATATVKIPSYTSSTGKRMMLQASMFSASDAKTFEPSHRTAPVYLRNPHTEIDDVRIQLPANLKVEAIPNDRKFLVGNIAEISINNSIDGSVLHAHRELRVHSYLINPEYYPGTRAFFSKVNESRSEQVVLTTP
jgi:hypothetical protein